MLAFIIILPFTAVFSYSAESNGDAPEFTLSYETEGTEAAVSFELVSGRFNSINLAFSFSENVSCLSIKKSDALRDFSSDNDSFVCASNADTCEAAFASFSSFSTAGAVFEIRFSLPENTVSQIKAEISSCSVSIDDEITEVAPVFVKDTLTIDMTPHVHSYKQTEKIDAECTVDGYIKYECECGDFYYETITAPGHSYSAVTTAPDCTHKGFTTYTCSECGDSYVSDYTDAKGHSYTEWFTTAQPTTSSPGSKFCICTVCGDVLTQQIPKLHKLTVTLSDKIIYCNDKGVIDPVAANPDNIGYSVVYESGNEKVLKIDDQGNYTASLRGSVKIKCVVTDEFGDEYTAICTYTVKFKFWQWVVYFLFFGWLWG